MKATMLYEYRIRWTPPHSFYGRINPGYPHPKSDFPHILREFPFDMPCTAMGDIIDFGPGNSDTHQITGRSNWPETSALEAALRSGTDLIETIVAWA